MNASASLDEFRVVARDRPIPPDVQWFHDWPSPRGGADPWLSTGRRGREYVLRFHGTADFVVDNAARRIEVRAEAGADAALVERLALGQVVPRAWSLATSPVLHSSAVARNGAAVAIVGPSGAGKSTLASGLCAAGCTLLADDVVPLREGSRGFICPPTAAAVWLGEGATALFSASGAPAADPPAPTPVRLVYLLERSSGGGPAISALPPREALLRLFALTYRLEMQDHAAQAREFDRLSRLVSSVPVRRLSMPHDLARLRETAALVIGELDAAGGSPGAWYNPGSP